MMLWLWEKGWLYKEVQVESPKKKLVGYLFYDAATQQAVDQWKQWAFEPMNQYTVTNNVHVHYP